MCVQTGTAWRVKCEQAVGEQKRPPRCRVIAVKCLAAAVVNEFETMTVWGEALLWLQEMIIGEA